MGCATSSTRGCAGAVPRDDRAPVRARAQRRLRHRRGRGAGARRHQPRRRPRRGRRPRRRERLRQDDPRARHPRDPAHRSRAHPRRRGALQGRGPAARGPRRGQRPRARARDHLHTSRSLHVVQPGVPRPDADHGPDEVEVAARGQRRRRAVAVPALPARALARRSRSRARDAARGADPRAHPRAPPAAARILRRAATAAHDRDGAAPAARSDHRRRADHLPRRDDPGPDPPAPAPAGEATRRLRHRGVPRGPAGAPHARPGAWRALLPSRRCADRGRRVSVTAAPLLEIVDLVRHFPVRNAFGRRTGWIRAVDGVSLAVWPGETLGLVGESGCGKSTLGKTVMGIYTPTAGDIRFAGREIGHLPARERRAVAGDLQYVYQDPGASLDPRWKVVHSLHEPLKIHTRLSRAEREREVGAILAAVGLPDAHLDLYPHELSGGQQRRVGLARILTLRPRMVILDEPTSGLDVSVQASVLKLFRSMQEAFALTYVFISHDLAVVRAMCARIAVMYLGTIVELGETAAIFEQPRHPYTRSLLAAVPRIGGRRVTLEFTLPGEPPNPRDVPSGCRFRTRCPLAGEVCAAEEPPLRSVGGRLVACHFA